MRKEKNPKLNSQTTKKGVTRDKEEKVQMKREASKALEEKKKLGLLPLSLVRSADINSEINERNRTRSARKRFLKRGLLGKDF